MNNEVMRALLAMTVFGAVLLGLACGNANQNTTNSTNSAVSAVPTGTQPQACSKGNVEAAINAAINGNNGLQSQYGAKRFNVAVDEYPSPGLLRVALSGKIMGEGAYQALMGSFNQFVRRGCVETVKFDAVVTTTLSAPFEWSASCESPCTPSGGSCICPMPSPIGANMSNTNSTSNSNSGSNTNANSNAKTNTNTNSNTRQGP